MSTRRYAERTKVPEAKSRTDGVDLGLEPLLVEMSTAAWLLSISERRVAELVKEGRLPYVRLGRRVLFPLKALREWVAALTLVGSLDRLPHTADPHGQGEKQPEPSGDEQDG